MRRHLNAFTGSFALHLLVFAALVWFSAAEMREAARLTAETPVSVSPPVLEPADKDTRDADAREAKESALDRLNLPGANSSSQLELPNFSFDFRKVRNRATTLFPFVTQGLSLEPVRQIVERSQRTSLVNPYARASASGSALPPLALSEAAIQAAVDKVWSRRERWSVFQPIAELTERYHPNAGQLPALLRTYMRQNLLQPYSESHVKDPRLWIMLGIAADHSDFIAFITEYAARHPSTKATTELLFMLDDMAQGSRDALATLLDVDTERELWWTLHKNKNAHGFIEIVQSYYRKKLEQRGIATTDALALHYDSVRLSILQAIVQDTPGEYRASDARFLIGAIYWKHGRAEDAVRWWREMTIDPANAYATSSEAVLSVLGDAHWQQVNQKEIDRILALERGRWTEFWWHRLKQFGFTFSAF